MTLNTPIGNGQEILYDFSCRNPDIKPGFLSYMFIKSGYSKKHFCACKQSVHKGHGPIHNTSSQSAFKLQNCGEMSQAHDILFTSTAAKDTLSFEPLH